MRIRQMLVILAVCVLVSSAGLAQNSPYNDNITVDLTTTQKKVSFDQKLDDKVDAFEKSISRGVEKAGKALDVLARDFDRILKDVSEKASKSPSVIIEENPGSWGGTSAQSSSGSTYQKGEVGAAGKNFWTSLVNLAKKFGSWAKSFWEQITGPGEDEAPIANGINKLKTEYHKWNLSRAWNNFTATGGQLFGAIGRFAKNLFS